MADDGRFCGSSLPFSGEKRALRFHWVIVDVSHLVPAWHSLTRTKTTADKNISSSESSPPPNLSIRFALSARVEVTSSPRRPSPGLRRVYPDHVHLSRNSFITSHHALAPRSALSSFRPDCRQSLDEAKEHHSCGAVRYNTRLSPRLVPHSHHNHGAYATALLLKLLLRLSRSHDHQPQFPG